MAFKIEGKEMSAHLCFHKVLLVSLFLSGKAWQACAQRTGKNHSHTNCSFISSLWACPASSASIECIFSTYALVWSKIRKILNAEKAEKWVKIYHCAELKKR